MDNLRETGKPHIFDRKNMEKPMASSRFALKESSHRGPVAFRTRRTASTLAVRSTRCRSRPMAWRSTAVAAMEGGQMDVAWVNSSDLTGWSHPLMMFGKGRIPKGPQRFGTQYLP